jgi:hypothetical protein
MAARGAGTRCSAAALWLLGCPQAQHLPGIFTCAGHKPNLALIAEMKAVAERLTPQPQLHGNPEIIDPR